MAADTSHNEPTATTADFGRSNVPRYIQLAMLFRARILSGRWPKGSKIPTLDELVEEYGVARATIRQALGLLEDEKLIERFRAKGTFVRSDLTPPIWREVGTDLKGLLRPTGQPQMELMREGHADDLTSHFDRFGSLAPRYVHLHRRNWVEKRPIVVTDVYVDADLEPLLTDKQRRTRTGMQMIDEMEGVEIADARQTLTVGMADVLMAEELQLPLNAPVAFVSRCAIDRTGRIVMISNSTYAGDIVRLDMRLK